MKRLFAISLGMFCLPLTAVANTIIVADFHIEQPGPVADPSLSLGLPYLIARMINSSGQWQALLPELDPSYSPGGLYNARGEPRLDRARLICEREGADRFLLARCRRQLKKGDSAETIIVNFYLVSLPGNKTDAFTLSCEGDAALPALARFAASKICPESSTSSLPSFPAACLPGFSHALYLFREDKLKEADEETAKLFEEYPQCADASYLSGLISARGNKPYRALRLFNTARNKDPRFALPAYAEAMVWLTLERPTLAEKSFAQAVRIQPCFFEAALELGITRAKRGAFKDAMETFRRALRLRPEHVNARYWSAYCLDKAGKESEALRTLDGIIGSSPRHGASRILRGELYYRGGDLKRATHELRVATTLLPDDERAHTLLGEVLSRLGEHAGAAREFKKALRLKGKNK